jgi:hypothetical protein
MEGHTMKARMILASAAGAMLLASPMAASAAGKTVKPATTASKDNCKNLKGHALKDCKAKATTAKKAGKTK